MSNQHNIDLIAVENTYSQGNSESKSKFQGNQDEFAPRVTCEQMTNAISIVFWDIRGFSRLYRAFSMVDMEMDMLDFLNQYYLIARKTISKNNGKWDKAIGDGILSWFGSTKDTSSDHGASDAVNAAIDLRSSFGELQRQYKTKWGSFQIQVPEFSLKCGINTGIAKLCLLYNQYTIMGTSVNLASRLQQYAKSNQIIISEMTRQKLRAEKYDLREILIDNNYPLKSFEDVQRCFEIVNV